MLSPNESNIAFTGVWLYIMFCVKSSSLTENGRDKQNDNRGIPRSIKVCFLLFLRRFICIEICCKAFKCLLAKPYRRSFITYCKKAKQTENSCLVCQFPSSCVSVTEVTWPSLPQYSTAQKAVRELIWQVHREMSLWAHYLFSSHFHCQMSVC